MVGGPIGLHNRSEGVSYIDGFVIAVPTANKQKFIEHARQLTRYSSSWAQFV